MHLESGFRIPPNWPSIWKRAMTSQFSEMTPSSIFFEVVLFLLSVLVTDPSLSSISSLALELRPFFFKGLARNPEIGNNLVLVLLNTWRLGQVRNTKFGKKVSSKMLLNAAKCQGHSFNRFWLIKGQPTGREVG